MLADKRQTKDMDRRNRGVGKERQLTFQRRIRLKPRRNPFFDALSHFSCRRVRKC